MVLAMKGNPNPSPKDRFRPGQSGNPRGKPVGRPDRQTILRNSAEIRPLEEVLADIKSFHGSMNELLESCARDWKQPIDVRLSCANALVRSAPPASDNPDANKSDAELWDELRELEQRYEQAKQREREDARIIEGEVVEQPESDPGTAVVPWPQKPNLAG
jgi:Family of unknown function (DUF5681)